MFLLHKDLTLDHTGSLWSDSIPLSAPELWRQPPTDNSIDGPGRICPEDSVCLWEVTRLRTSSERRSSPSKQSCWESLPAAAWSQVGRRSDHSVQGAAGGERLSSLFTDVEHRRGLPTSGPNVQPVW